MSSELPVGLGLSAVNAMQVRTRDRSMTIEALNFFFGGRASRAVAQHSRPGGRSKTSAPHPMPREIVQAKQKAEVHDLKGKKKVADDESHLTTSTSSPEPAEAEAEIPENLESKPAVKEEEIPSPASESSATERCRKRLLIVTVGSRGDVPSFLALGSTPFRGPEAR